MRSWFGNCMVGLVGIAATSCAGLMGMGDKVVEIDGFKVKEMETQKLMKAVKWQASEDFNCSTMSMKFSIVEIDKQSQTPTVVDAEGCDRAASYTRQEESSRWIRKDKAMDFVPKIGDHDPALEAAAVETAQKFISGMQGTYPDGVVKVAVLKDTKWYVKRHKLTGQILGRTRPVFFGIQDAKECRFLIWGIKQEYVGNDFAKDVTISGGGEWERVVSCKSIDETIKQLATQSTP